VENLGGGKVPTINFVVSFLINGLYG